MLRQAQNDVIIVAPYIKTYTLRRLISDLSHELTSLTCVTRWLPEDIAAGVSDLDIFSIINTKQGGRLLVHPHLHAKYYRGDERCLLGSANLTSRGLGWTTPANVELLVELPWESQGLMKWEKALLFSSVPATQQMRDQISQEATRIQGLHENVGIPEVEEGQEEDQAATYWVPKCSIPDRLWDVYSGLDSEITMLASTRETAQHDLRVLKPPLGLSKPLFEAYSAGILKQMPLFMTIDTRASNGLSDTEAHAFLEGHLGNRSPYSPKETWEVLKAWLIHFMGSSYRVETREDVLVRGQRLSDSDSRSL